jgi:hypothetical protein
MYHTLGSEHSLDFHRPVTVKALEYFDPDLKLVYNRRYGCFQVMRMIRKIMETVSSQFGHIAYTDDVAVYVKDWKDGLLNGDDPRALIKSLWESDLQRHETLATDRVIQMRKNKLRQLDTVKDNYSHAQRDNASQLEKAYEPVVRFPSLIN